METTAPYEPKRGVGRPTDYSPEYNKLIIRAGAEGLSKTQMAARIGVARQTLDYWATSPECKSDDGEQFSTALAFALTLQQAYWEDQQHKMASDPMHKGNATLQHLMKSRFREDYGDRQELTHSGTIEGLDVVFVNARHVAAEEDAG